MIVTGIVPADQVQAGVFDATDREKDAKASSALDRLNARFGRGTIQYAIQGNERTYWHPRHEKLTPRYTTRWGELPRVELGK